MWIRTLGLLVLGIAICGCAPLPAQPESASLSLPISAPDAALTAAIAVPAESTPAPVVPGECGETTFYSEALARRMQVSVYLPPGYHESARRYPTLYFLSGGGGNHLEWRAYGLCTVMDKLIAEKQIQPFIVVMPAGSDGTDFGRCDPRYPGLGSYWLNHAPPPASQGGRWGDYVWRDLVQFADATYRTLPQRQSRAIGGLSAGGQAALIHALRHPDLFSAAGGHSAAARTADGSLACFGDETYFEQYEAAKLVYKSEAPLSLRLWLDDGDRSNWLSASVALHDLLDGLAIPHEWHILPGEHQPLYWQIHIWKYLAWYSQNLQGE